MHDNALIYMHCALLLSVHIVDMALVKLQNNGLPVSRQTLNHLKRIGFYDGIGLNLFVLQLPYNILVTVFRRSSLTRQPLITSDSSWSRIIDGW